MLRYVIRRLLYLGFVLWIISMFTFGLLHLSAPHPEFIIAGRGATAERLHQIREELHLDDPAFRCLCKSQYVRFVDGLVSWPPNLGVTYDSNREPVLDRIADRLPVTASVAFGALVLWLAIGIPIGIQAATHPRSVRDRVATLFALTGLSMPTFFLGLVLVFALAYKLRSLAHIDLVPFSGYVPFTENPLSWAHHLILPWLTLALVSAAIYSRMTRGSLLEVLGEDYVRTARAKGLSERRVVYRHGLRSALTPIVTLIGLDLGTLLGGAIVTEQVFGLSGIGAEAVRAVQTDNQPVIIGTVLVASFFIVMANVVIDIVYAMLDARIRYT